MSNSQPKLLIDDTDDEVTTPGSACLPIKLIAFHEVKVLGSLSTDEEYYRHLSAALDAALDL